MPQLLKILTSSACYPLRYLKSSTPNTTNVYTHDIFILRKEGYPGLCVAFLHLQFDSCRFVKRSVKMGA